MGMVQLIFLHAACHDSDFPRAAHPNPSSGHSDSANSGSPSSATWRFHAGMVHQGRRVVSECSLFVRRAIASWRNSCRNCRRSATSKPMSWSCNEWSPRSDHVSHGKRQCNESVCPRTALKNRTKRQGASCAWRAGCSHSRKNTLPGNASKRFVRCKSCAID